MHGGGLGKQGPQGAKLGPSMVEGRGLVSKELGSISSKLKVLVCILATPQGARHSVIELCHLLCPQASRNQG